jgi:DNA excision repair protein ERCC-2
MVPEAPRIPPEDGIASIVAGAPGYTIAVRALCEFTAKRGDLDLRFTPSPTGAEGIEGHGVVTARRAAGYQTEVSLEGDFGPLRVRGRADGWDPAARRLEEIKTYRGDLAHVPDNHRQLHWAQVRIYGALICRQLGLAEVELALVYFNIDTRKETVFTESHPAIALQAFFEDQCQRFTAWSAQETAHRAARDAALNALQFPLPSFRTGQREMAEAVYRCARAGRCLMAQAPTGIGKTVGTLFPLLKAAPPDLARPDAGLDKVFYLAAKTSGRQLALDALQQIRASATHPPLRGGLPQAPLRVLELVARDKACEHPDKACHGDSCPLARGFYDRLPAARQAAVDEACVAKPAPQAIGCAEGVLFDKATLREIALRHDVCPYYLGQELARWADVVVGDYNYWFDTSAMLFAMTQMEGWRVAVLVDEAHNLVERARGMYSAELEQGALKALRRAATAVSPPLKRTLDRLNRTWNELQRDQATPYVAADDIPVAFTEALHQTLATLTDLMVDHPALVADLSQAGADLQRFTFDALHFARIAGSFGPHSLFDITLRPGRTPLPGRPAASTLCVRNIVPAPHLHARFAAARTVVLFSATLSPRPYHADLLGLPANTAWIDVPSPFCARQLTVRVARDISTRWRDREKSLAPIVELIARQYAAKPGHYLAFFSSYDYLDQVFGLLRERHPALPCWEQQRQMPEAAREVFLARFTPGGQGIGFAVLGGAFAEGIDLPGDRLIGAFIATLGLPQVNPVNEQIRARMEAAFAGRGYDYTYLYPGLQKVVQAAGRVIRTPADEGVLVLMDDRFARAEVRALLPAWWEPGEGSWDLNLD